MTAAIRLLESYVPVLSLGVLYIFAVMTIAVLFGIHFALPVAVASMVAFDWFFLIPERILALNHVANWLVLAVYAMTAVVVSELAARARRRADVSDRARAVLADEQASLRRVATLVAHEAPPAKVFTAVAEEAGRLLGADTARLVRYESDDTGTVVASSSSPSAEIPIGTRLTLEGDNAAGTVLRTRRPARMDSFKGASGSLSDLQRRLGIKSAVGSPITVQGSLWGVMILGSTRPEPFPEGTESRIGDFTELVATAIANAEAHEEITRLADEQAALRRVATLVARGVPPHEVFDVVAQEVTMLLGGDMTHVVRREPDDSVTTLARWGLDIDEVPVGTRTRPEEPMVTAQVLRTGRPARIEGYEGISGASAAALRRLGIRSSVGSPILVGGRLWGVVVVSSKKAEPPPLGTEERIENFAELVATAISNAEARAQLTASRARIVAASDETRRRIERDLHDGAQQRLVSLGLELRAVTAAVPPDLDDLAKQLSEVADGLTGVMEDLREISRGIHPAILSEGGLTPALKAMARRSALPVDLDARVDERLPDQVEVAAYFVVSEALANAAKHARASVGHVEVEVRDGILRVAVHDDGAGGADPARGTGLVGLTDRVEALGGKIEVVSPPGHGTSLVAELPLAET